MEIKEQIEEQIRAAMHGIDKDVSNRQTETGIKDKVAQHWIGILLKKAKEMKKADPNRSLESVVEELLAWYQAQPGDKMNPLFDIEGMFGCLIIWLYFFMLF